MRSVPRQVHVRAVLFLVAGLAISMPANAAGFETSAGDFTLGLAGQLRVRGIVDSGRDFADGDFLEREYLTQRARLGASLGHTSGAGVTIVLQDSRVWGEELNTLNDFSANGFDAHEAFASIPLVGGLSLKLGRQEMNFDNQRLVGAVGWVQRARSFDALRFTLKRSRFDVDAFYALVSEKDTDGDGNVPTGPDARGGDVGFGGLHGGMTLAEGHRLNLAWYGLTNVPTEHYRHTLGLFADGKVAGLGYNAELYYQLGTLADEPISALLAAARVSYALDVTAKPSIAVWCEYLSGDGTAEGTFDTLFATNHKFYGEMDFFLAIPRHTGNLGLLDVGGRLAAKPVNKLSTHLDIHLLRTATADANGASDLGLELDFKAVIAAAERVKVVFLYGVYLPGEAMATLRGVPAGTDAPAEHFAYLTVDVSL